MLSKSVETLVRAVHFDNGFRTISLFSVHRLGGHDSLGVAEELFARQVRERDRTALFFYCDLQSGGGEGDILF